MRKKIAYLLLFLLVVTAIIWYVALRVRAESDILTVAFLNVGQGDAIFIEAPNGNQVLIDAGPSKGVLREIGRVMPFFDRSIDLVIATHPDADHIGGLPTLFERYSVDTLLDTGLTADTDVYIVFEEMLEQQAIQRLRPSRGTRITLDEGIVLSILFPDREVGDMESNSASLIARLVYGESEFLFTGDAPQSIENYVASLGDIESDVLKVGHHGSKTSTSEYFIAAVSPKYAIISAGVDNRYGHPHEEVIGRLKEAGIEILETANTGTIIFETDGKSIFVR